MKFLKVIPGHSKPYLERGSEIWFTLNQRVPGKFPESNGAAGRI